MVRQPDSPPAPSATPYRLIIKFKPTVADPAAAEFQQRLSAEVGVPFQYVRPMSGGAHVFTVQGTWSTAERQALLKELSGRSDVVYAEEDIVMRPMMDK